MVDKENFAKDINVPRKEPIMFDGVDVSGCKYLPYCIDKQGNCAFEPNCYFKQNARKTQECEQIKKELKELKRQYKLSCLDCEYKNTKTDADRYRKALEEIEVTANKAVELPCVFSCDCNNCAEKPTKNGDTCIQGAIFKIAGIIKKVKN